MAATDQPGIPSSPEEKGASPAKQPHNFAVQKEIHRRIRNDPDYDDWEYGTEPLPHEAWVEKDPSTASPAAAGSGEGTAGM
jgi:hypothetical protein